MYHVGRREGKNAGTAKAKIEIVAKGLRISQSGRPLVSTRGREFGR
jgi:hypothetical protein